jgi:hypothetical protein
MKPLSIFGYAVFVAAILFGLFSIGDGASDQTATMAPDLHLRR